MEVVNDQSLPSCGDIVFVPDGYGTWVLGLSAGFTIEGNLLIGVARGALKLGGTLVAADPKAHLLEWAWPTDMPEAAQSHLRNAEGRLVLQRPARFER